MKAHCAFIPSLPPPFPHCPALIQATSLLLPSTFWGNHSLNWKRDPGATGTWFPLFFRIIDSCCLVIHRLHMPAYSSGEEKLPTSQPCVPQTHTHTPFCSSPSCMCMNIETQTYLLRLEFSHVIPPHHQQQPPQKSQELGMRGGNKRHVSR